MAVAVYKGFSTLDNKFGSVRVTDTKLIKRDLLNHFAIRKGEKLMNGKFGTSIQDLIMDPLTEETKQIVVQEINEVINTDSRISAESIVIEEYEAGILVEMTLRYVLTNEVENLAVRFDRSDEQSL